MIFVICISHLTNNYYMGLFKRNPFGHILFIKKWLIRILGVLTHRRFRGFNELAN